MFSDSDELIIPTNRMKLISIVLGSAGIVIASILIILMAGQENVIIAIFCVISIVFFGLCGIYSVRRLIRPTPALVINRDGIWDNASALGVGFIDWDDIAEIHEYQYFGKTFLCIIPNNADALLAKQPVWKCLAIRRNCLLGGALVNIPETMLPMTVSELLYEIRLRFGR